MVDARRLAGLAGIPQVKSFTRPRQVQGSDPTPMGTGFHLAPNPVQDSSPGARFRSDPDAGEVQSEDLTLRCAASILLDWRGDPR
jgi:hypothetical protein